MSIKKVLIKNANSADCQFIMVTLDDGTVVTVGAGWVLPPSYPNYSSTKMEFIGSKGAIMVDDSHSDVTIMTGDRGIEYPMSSMPGEPVAHVNAGPMAEETNNFINKKFFFQNIKKDYKSTSYISVIDHQKLKNNTSVQIFTKRGPLAFLPISNFKTSLVYSVNDKLDINENEFKELVKKYNKFYKIKRFYNVDKFKLNFFLSKKYTYKNILSFGDTLHKVHPLAGQGFNMTVRDIKSLTDQIQKNIDLGLELSTAILSFEKERKHNNFFFAYGIDFLHNFFEKENRFKILDNKKISETLDNSFFLKKISEKFANKGFNF